MNAYLITMAERVEAIRDVRLPNLRRVGAYAFFAVLSFSAGTLVGAFLANGVGMKKDVAHLASSVVMLSSFLALRDMTRDPFTRVAAALRALATKGDE